MVDEVDCMGKRAWKNKPSLTVQTEQKAKLDSTKPTINNHISSTGKR